MLQKSILGEIKKKITPSIYTIGKEYYDKRLGNLTALFADGNVMTVEGEYKENHVYKTSLTFDQEKVEFLEADCDCMFFQKSKKNLCKHIIALGFMSDKSKKVSEIIGTNEAEMLFEDEFEEDNKNDKIIEEPKKVEKKVSKEVKDKKESLTLKKAEEKEIEKEGKSVQKEISEKDFELEDEEKEYNLDDLIDRIDEIRMNQKELGKTEKEEMQELRLEVEIDEGSYSDYKYGYGYDDDYNPGYVLRLKTGFSKTYYIKDILKFVNAVIEESEYSISTKIKYNPVNCYFNESDKKIIEAIYEYHKEISSVVDNGIKDKKGLKVYEMLLNKLLLAMKDGRNILFLGERRQILNNYEPIFLLENGKIELRKIRRMTSFGGFFTFANDTTKIFRMAENEEKLLRKLSGMNLIGLNQLPDETNQKLKEILENENINIAEYVDKSGTVDVYVQEMENRQLLRISLSNIVQSIEKNGKYFIPRKNVEVFEELKTLIKELAFKETEDYEEEINEDTSIVDYEALGKLSEIIDKKYRDKVKIHLDTNIKKAKDIHVNIEVKKAQSDMLNINFEVEGIDPIEIENVIEAIKNERKYVTLSSGELVKIANKSVEELLGIVDSISNIKLGENKISKIKALQLAQVSRTVQDELGKLDEFKELFHKIKNRKEQEPTNINVKLFPYQKLGFNWLKNMYDVGFGGVLADDMGLGKTLQTISLLNEIYRVKKDFFALIIVPSSLLYNWKEEIIKFSGIKPILVEGTAAHRKELIEKKKKGLLITTYQALRNDIDEYKNKKFEIVVLDEAQNIKTATSQIKKAVMKLNSKVNFALTGTPVENNILELWSIFDFVLPGYLDNLTKFKKTYKEALVNPNSAKVTNLREIIAPFLLRRTKKEVLTELPEKMESNMIVTLSSEQKQLYLSYVKQAKKEMKKFNENENNRMKILAILTKLRQICNSPTLFKEDYKGEVAKLQVLRDLLPDITENGHRLLIFSQFVGTLKEIEKELVDLGIEYFYIDGNVKSKERMEISKKFNAGQRQVVLISLKAGGTGLNLVGADVVIHYDPWWNVAVENQASDRAYRIGQKKSVQVIKLVTEGTIEEKIIKIQENKKQLSENLLESKDNDKVLFEMSDKELMDLLA